MDDMSQGIMQAVDIACAAENIISGATFEFW